MFDDKSSNKRRRILLKSGAMPPKKIIEKESDKTLKPIFKITKEVNLVSAANTATPADMTEAVPLEEAPIFPEDILELENTLQPQFMADLDAKNLIFESDECHFVE